MQKLDEMGFDKASTVIFDNKKTNIIFNIDKYRLAKNVLYAFVFERTEGEPEEMVRYIGHTRKTFVNRMNGYQAGKGRAVNNRVNRAIVNHLRMRGSVSVYVLSDRLALNMHGLHVDVAAGLEYSLIEYYCLYNKENGHDPLLNIAGNTCRQEVEINMSEPDVTSQLAELEEENMDYGDHSAPNAIAPSAVNADCGTLPCKYSFLLTNKTYWPLPVFNVPIAYQRHFGVHGDIVQVDLTGVGAATVDVRINRTANQNQTPRLYFSENAGVAYQHWKQSNHSQGDSVTVELIEYNHVRLA